MKCIRCQHDSKKKDRNNRTCPQCGKPFAFEPTEGDPVTDMLFSNAIERISGGGRLRWGVEHLYYEVCRRRRKRFAPGDVPKILLAAFVVACLIGIVLSAATPVPPLPFMAAAFVLTAILIGRYRIGLADPTVTITAQTFSTLWDRWCRVHGTPNGVIKRRQRQDGAEQPAIEPDIGDYSFDRAVICDRARTADLLIANNFHFENNCAVLTVDGYPRAPFATIMTMLKRNPKLQVYALHDATPAGCTMSHKIASDPAWFDGGARVIDLGLRPSHAGPFRGLLQVAAAASVVAGPGISEAEAKWLSTRVLELAAVRPEQALKRLFHGMRSHADDDFSQGGVAYCGSFDSATSADGMALAGAAADGADSFG